MNAPTSVPPTGVPTGQSPDLLEERPWLAHYEPGVPAEIEVPPVTLDRLLRDAATRWPARVALVFLGARTTYAELDRAVDRMAAALHQMGVAPGDRVSIHLPTTPAFVIGFLGTLRAGAIAAPVSPLSVEREIRELLAQTRPRVSICLDLLVPRVRAARAELGDVLPAATGTSGVISTGIQDSLPRLLRMLYPLKARREGRWRPVPHSAETPNLFRLLSASPAERIDSPARSVDPAVLQPTGGTTGTPKAATLTHRNLVANAIQVAAWFPGARPGEATVLCALPYFHIYGLTVALDYALLMGATQILHPRFDPHAVLKSIARYRPQLFPGAPMFYATLLQLPETQKYDLHSVDACISGSAPLPGPVQDGFEALTGGRVSEGYGLTEASPVTHCNPVHGERRLGTVGLPFPSTEAQVVDLEAGARVLPPGEVGELRVRGPQVMSGYWERPEETATALRDGWLYTGDISSMDAEGYFRIVDRRKDMIIVSGVNVYPREIEDVLHEHPAVVEAAVIGEPHPLKGEVPHAFVVLRAGTTVTPEELIAHCHQNLSPYKVPAIVEVRAELPRSFVGKVLRRVLAEEAAAAGGSAGAAAPATGSAGPPD
ncbi:MAG: long-chain fatty acid--CoA ligase [Chloroflexi bacterium]|nr:long-chain fatty acid--CoA ligase [Chloroflexota bacterium]